MTRVNKGAKSQNNSNTLNNETPIHTKTSERKALKGEEIMQKFRGSLYKIINKPVA